MPFFVRAFSVSPRVFFKMNPRVYVFFWWFTSLCFSSLFSQLILFGLPGCAVVKNPPATVGDSRDLSSIPGLGRSLQKGMAPHSSILAWRIPWTEEPGGSSPWGCKELDTTEQEHTVLTQCIIFWVQDNFFFLFLLFSLTTLHHKTCVGITF